MRLNDYQLTLGDAIYASLSIDGSPVANINSTRFGSISDIISLIYHVAGRFAGTAKLLIRNQSRGWNTTMTIASNSKPAKSNMPAKQPVVENGQYLIPW